jgi:hypothetical protein
LEPLFCLTGMGNKTPSALTPVNVFAITQPRTVECMNVHQNCSHIYTIWMSSQTCYDCQLQLKFC